MANPINFWRKVIYDNIEEDKFDKCYSIYSDSNELNSRIPQRSSSSSNQHGLINRFESENFKINENRNENRNENEIENIKMKNENKNENLLTSLEELVFNYYQTTSSQENDLSKRLLNILKKSLSNKEEDESNLQIELFDLLGASEEALKLIEDIIMLYMDWKQKLISYSLNSDTGMSESFFSKNILSNNINGNNIQIGSGNRLLKEEKGIRSQLDSRTARLGPQVSIQTEYSKILEKSARKEARSQRRRAKRQGIDINDMISATEEDKLLHATYLDSIQDNKGSETALKYLNLGNNQILEFNDSKFRELPPNSERIDEKDWEQVRIPAQLDEMAKNDPLVPISVFPEWSRPAFTGITSLNRMQSKVYKSAFYSNENLLVCAPTGAGKTNVALLTIMRALSEQRDENGVLSLKDFKVVYVAPMKALASEMVESFQKKLLYLGVKVKELTGDMQLTLRELEQTQMIVTTPEKWDVITRKSTESGMAGLVKLLIMDEVHLLHEERGAVLESLIARTLRQVERQQSIIRILGLSATLPNYKDVAKFLHVNPSKGLFHFGDMYRPVPLEQTFVGVKPTNFHLQTRTMQERAYDFALDTISKEKQVMVFVHSRKNTYKTAQAFIDIASKNETLAKFRVDPNQVDGSTYGKGKKDVEKSKNSQLKELFAHGMGIHHAGMVRKDRLLEERLFRKGLIRVLFCTATLAWGVNLPAHTVIICGTQVYDASHGGFKKVGILDVMQIFGRAGRPQYDSSGIGIILCPHNELYHYINSMSNQVPIESKFLGGLMDHLNAEITLGTVSSVRDASIWLSYTYMYQRMLINPMVYGITYEQKLNDPLLSQHKSELIMHAAEELSKLRMIRFDHLSGNLSSTHIGRIASHYYLHHDTVELLNDKLQENSSVSEILYAIAQSSEFKQIQVREEELKELDNISLKACRIGIIDGVENTPGKVSALIQAFISRHVIKSFSLQSDLWYICQNIGRLFRAAFELALYKRWLFLTEHCLDFCKSIDRQVWWMDHPLRQFSYMDMRGTSRSHLKNDILVKLESLKDPFGKLEGLVELDANEIGELVHHHRMGGEILKYCRMIPYIELSSTLLPITESIVRIKLFLQSDFNWIDKFHGRIQSWWIWVEDSNNTLHHSELFLLNKKDHKELLELEVMVPVYYPIPNQYFIRIVSDRWIGAESTVSVSFIDIQFPRESDIHTDLLPLQPLPISSLQNPLHEELYPFPTFNPIQSQVFHMTRYSDNSILLAAPTGSGKTVVAELAMMRLFSQSESNTAVYIAPLKALVKERVRDWRKKFRSLGIRVVELTGESTPEIHELSKAQLIITVPEKWDSITRSWMYRSYVKKVRLMIIDELHLLGGERGPILEVIISRLRFICRLTSFPTRIIALSTHLANPIDVGRWLGISRECCYNFHPRHRPIPLTAHIAGFPGKHYCPRMATMNRPAYQAILEHSENKPVIIFVASRRQTRLTANDLIPAVINDGQPHKFFLNSDKNPVETVQLLLPGIQDPILRHTLSFGIGLHHSGLLESDRRIVEDLFLNGVIQIIVSTSTLAWGINLPAHLVIIKGTEFYDAKTHKYVDMPITDVMQMMGRAGRPQFDDSAVAVIFVEESKKNYLKKFLYSPFPIESDLHSVLSDHLNAEIAAGTISSKQDCLNYLTLTYFWVRVHRNPSFYNIFSADRDNQNSVEGISEIDIINHVNSLIQKSLEELRDSGCILLGAGNILEKSLASLEGEFSQDNLQYGVVSVAPTDFSIISSKYYLSHLTIRFFRNNLKSNMNPWQILNILSQATEFEEVPVRHSEDEKNQELSSKCIFPVPAGLEWDNPFLKTQLLLQSHISNIKDMPISDYHIDQRIILDSSFRILQGLIEVCAYSNILSTTLSTIHLYQSLIQGRLYGKESQLFQCSSFNEQDVELLNTKGFYILPQLCAADLSILKKILPHKKHDSDWNKIKKIPFSIKIDSTKNGCFIDNYGDAKLDLCLSNLKPSSLFSLDLQLVSSNLSKRKRKVQWWIIVGIPECDYLLHIERVKGMNKYLNTVSPLNLNIEFSLDLSKFENLNTVTVYFMCDSYIGLDQEISIPVHEQ